MEKLENVKSYVGDSAFLPFLDISSVSNHMQKQITFFANYNTAVISFDDLPLKKRDGAVVAVSELFSTNEQKLQMKAIYYRTCKV